MSSRTYDFTLGAAVGAVHRLDVLGSRVRLVSNAAGTSLRIRTNKGDDYTVQEGQGFRMPDGQMVREIFVINTAAVATTGTVFVGDENFEDARVTGNVRIIDQSADKTLSGNQFLGGQSQNPDAANQSVVSIRATGGKRIAVKSMTVISSIAGDFIFNLGSGPGTATPMTAQGYNKLQGGAASSGAVSAGIAAPATVLAAGELPGASVIGARLPVLASTPQTVNLPTPIVLTGTAVLAVLGLVVNRQISAIFDWEEL